MADIRYRYELIQDGIVVASVDSPDDERARSEIMHYAAQYAEDGPCMVCRCRPVEPRRSKKQRGVAVNIHESDKP